MGDVRERHIAGPHACTSRLGARGRRRADDRARSSARYLERAGYETRVAADGPAALEAAGERRVDLVVLDLMLPGHRRPGGDAQAAPRRPDRAPAIILLTARGEESDRITGLRLGADDYVVKPFSPGELVARVDAVLRRAARRRRPSPQVDPGGRRGHRRRRRAGSRAAARRSRSPQREFELLTFLARHPGQAFTREELMERVWRFSFYTDTSTVTVHVRRLRAKLEPDPDAPRLIETVWGVGYRFAAAAIDPRASPSRWSPRRRRIGARRRWRYGGDAGADDVRAARAARAPRRRGGARARGAARAASAGCAGSSPRVALLVVAPARRSSSPCSSADVRLAATTRSSPRCSCAYAATLGALGACLLAARRAWPTSTRSGRRSPPSPTAAATSAPASRAAARSPTSAADVDAMIARAGRRGARPPRAGRRRLARPAHADHVAAAAGRGDRGRRGRRARRAREYVARMAHARARARRADRRPVRADAPGGRRAALEDGAGRAGRARRGGGRGDAPAGRGVRAWTCARVLDAGDPLRDRRRRAAAARALQPHPERDPPHPGRRER